MDTYKGEENVKKVRLQTLGRQYKLPQMDKSECIFDYIRRFMSLVNQIKACGEVESSFQIVEKVL